MWRVFLSKNGQTLYSVWRLGIIPDFGGTVRHQPNRPPLPFFPATGKMENGWFLGTNGRFTLFHNSPLLFFPPRKHGRFPFFLPPIGSFGPFFPIHGRLASFSLGSL